MVKCSLCFDTGIGKDGKPCGCMNMYQCPCEERFSLTQRLTALAIVLLFVAVISSLIRWYNG